MANNSHPVALTKEQIALGAKAAVENKAIMAILAQLEHDAHAAWAGTDLHDQAKREIAFVRQRVVVELRTALQNLSRDTERKGDTSK